MKGTHFRVDDSEVSLFEDGMRFAPLSAHGPDEPVFPSSAYDRFMYIADGGDFGWRRYPYETAFFFSHMKIDGATVRLADEFLSATNERPFFTVNDFEGGRGEPITAIAAWSLEFVAGYVAGKLLDQILEKIRGREQAAKWKAIEDAIGHEGSIRIVLGRDAGGERILKIQDVPIALTRLTDEQIREIVAMVRRSPVSLRYDKSGLKVDDPYRLHLYDERA